MGQFWLLLAALRLMVALACARVTSVVDCLEVGVPPCLVSYWLDTDQLLWALSQ